LIVEAQRVDLDFDQSVLVPARQRLLFDVLIEGGVLADGFQVAHVGTEVGVRILQELLGFDGVEPLKVLVRLTAFSDYL